MMKGFLIRTAVSAVALLVIAGLSNGQIVVKGFVAAILAALVIGIANAVVKPILEAIAGGMTCMLSCLTLGLWSLVLSWLLSGLMFYVAGQFVPGFTVKSFGPALWGALALAIINSLATVMTRQDPQNYRR